MAAQVIELAPYIERKAQKKQEQYTPEQFLQEASFHWLEFLLAMIEGTKPSADHPKRP